MTPADLDAIERDALRDAPRCAACGALATRACRGTRRVGCGLPYCETCVCSRACPDGMATLPVDPRLAMARALREAWQERDGLNDARNVLTDAVAGLTRERDAALAAVDAVRADYAPRREPPTADEVRAVSRLWGASNAPVLLQIPRGLVTANVSTGVRGSIVGWTEPDVRRVAAAESWLFLGPNGPVAWSELAALVRGGDRG